MAMWWKAGIVVKRFGQTVGWTVTFALLFVVAFGAHTEESAAIEVEPIVVTPSAYTLAEAAAFAKEIDMAEAANLPLIDNDLLRTVHLFPGVISNDFSARFQLRGSEKDEVLVRLDGMDLYYPFHLPDFDGAISVIDPSLVSKAQLFMGGFSPSLGDRMGGVFDIQTIRPRRKKRTRVGLDLLKTQLLTEGPLGSGSYVVSLRRGYIDLIMDLIDAIRPLDEKFRPRYFDAFAKVSYPVGDRQTLTWTALYARDTNLVDKLGELDDLESAYDNLLVWGEWAREIGDDGKWSLRPYAGFAARDRREGRTDVDVRHLRYGGVRTDFALPFGGNHTAETGGDVRLARGEYDYFETTSPFPRLDNSAPPFDVDTSLEGADVTLYAQDEWQFSTTLAATVGARMLWQSYRDGVVWSPRIAVAYRPVMSLTFRAAAGRFLQPIDVLRLPVEGNIARPRSPERADHLIVGAEWVPSKALSIRFEVYRKRYDHLVGRSRDVGRQTQIFQLPTSGKASGAELFIQHQASRRFAWSGGYAYATTQFREGNRTFPRSFDQRHTILLSGAYQVSETLTVNVSWRFHTGNPYTPVTFEPTSTGLKPRIGPPNSKRLPPFHSLDVRFTKRYRFTRWELTAYLQIINAYARANVHEYAYDPAQNYARVEEDLLPITPTFGLTATF